MGNSKSRSYKRVLVPFSEEQLASVFKNYDGDRDGKLTKKELKRAFNYLGSRNGSYRAVEALCAADVDGDGVISLEEMNKLIQYTKDCNYTLS